ncbi:MAG: sialate O-acetylesterase [Paludibacteraceae bacterium]|nr:sialate O-acetylesterase [Paludibacteraceae bacterium]
MMRRVVTIIMGALVSLNAFALDMPDIFGDNMVLQQQSQAKIWGWADSGNQVKVTTSWNGMDYLAKANKDGYWSVRVQTPQASFVDYTIDFEERNGEGKKSHVVEKRTSSHVLIGEVWFCSGQSNMEMPLRGFWNCPVEGAQEAIVSSARYSQMIRMATVPKTLAQTPQRKVVSPWKECQPKNVSEFSACGYFFAQTLVQLLKVPVGIINCSYGGSCLEGWLPKETLLTYPDGLVPMDNTDYHSKMAMYNAMLYPLAGYTVKGFLWNQGESNVGKEKEYADRFCTMTRLWRKLFDDEENRLPMYAVELPPYSYGDANGTFVADFRVAQHNIAKTLENYACVCTSDLVYDFEKEQVHGSQKRAIGERLAYLALSRDYGLEGIPFQYPEFEYMEEVEADKNEQAVIAGSKVAQSSVSSGKVLHLYFSNARDGFDRLSDIEGFEAQSSDGSWHKAKVWASSVWDEKLQKGGCYLVLSCPEAGTIKNIRYCYHNFMMGRLHNVYGMPVVPFTTEK